MHPGYFFWKRAQEHARNHHDHHAAEHCGPGFHGESRWAGADEQGAGLGVRRPLRFLAHRLDLKESQVAELARILNELKTERAQAEVDDRRTLAAFADAVGAEAFDDARAKEGATLRIESAQKLRDAVLKALGRIHAMLDAEQRSQLAYLIRTGTLTL